MLSIDHALQFDTLLTKGVLAGTPYFPYEKANHNFYNVKASLTMWPDKWTQRKRDSLGWFAWLIGYQCGYITAEDEFQISRWQSFARRHANGLLQNALRQGVHISDKSFWPRARQAMLHWALDSEHPRTYVGFCSDLMLNADQLQLSQLGYIPNGLDLQDSTGLSKWLEINKPVPHTVSNLKATLMKHLPQHVVTIILNDFNNPVY